MDIAKGKQNNSQPVAANAVFRLLLATDGTLQLRLQPALCKDVEAVSIFRQLSKETEGLNSGHILLPDAYVEDEEGGYWTLQGVHHVLSLETLISRQPGIVANDPWKEDFIARLLDTIDSLHRRGLFAIELTLSSVMVTSDSHHSLMLLPPCSAFLPLQRRIWKEGKAYLAPELTTEAEPSRRIDIYATGFLMNSLYPLGDMPFKFRKAVTVAMDRRPEHRFATIGEMQRLMERKQRFGHFRSIAGTAVVLLGIAAVGLWGFQEEEPVPFTSTEEMEEEKDSTSEQQLMREVEQYLRDTTYMMADTAFTLSEDTKQRQRVMMEKTQEAFSLKFREMATPIVRQIYSKEMLKGDFKTYQENIKTQGAKLQQIQNQIASEMGIETSTANRLANEVIQQLADEFTKASTNL